jgi:tetratricopeptide (TPR) repeat protein
VTNSEQVHDGLKSELARIGEDFEVGILEAALKGNEDNFEILFALGNAYTRTGKYEEGLRIDMKLMELEPDNPVVHYNYACSLSLLGRIVESLGELEKSFKLGYREYNHTVSDPDLENVRKDERFGKLIERYLDPGGGAEKNPGA